MAYGMKLTTIGAAKLAAAAADETAISFTKVVWGNANGVAYEPTGEEANLVNQIHETNVLGFDVVEDTPNVFRIDGELVSAPSEFTLLEVGILDEEGDLVAIGNHPPQFVPGPSSSFTLNYHPSWFLVISPELAVAVTLAPIGDAEAMARGIENALDDPGAPEERIARAAAFSMEEGFAVWARLVDDLAAGRRDA